MTTNYKAQIAELEADLINQDIELQKLRERNRVYAKDNTRLVKTSAALIQERDTLLNISHLKKVSRQPYNVVARKGRHEAVPIMMLSDIHPAETFTASEVGGGTGYNPEVCAKRMKNFAVNSRKLIEMTRQQVNVDRAILWLGGDMINGYIHDEFLINNAFGPAKEVEFIHGLIRRTIETLLDDTKLQKLIIPCSVGNHGRTTDQMPSNRAAETNWEGVLYYWVMSDFANDKRVQFVFPPDYLTELEVFNKVLRFHHGDAVRYSGGRSGPAPGIQAKHERWNEASVQRGLKPASRDFLGHYHTLLFHPQFVLNGSFPGYNPYGRRGGYSADPPQQAFVVLDSDYGFTIHAPILLEKD